MSNTDEYISIHVYVCMFVCTFNQIITAFNKFNKLAFMNLIIILCLDKNAEA